MKRALYEWAAMTLTCLAIACLLITVITLSSNVADFELAFLPMTFETRCSKGVLVLSDCLVNQDFLDQWVATPGEPAVTSDLHLPIWGCGFRFTRFADGGSSWYVRLSTLVLSALSAGLSAFFWLRFRRIRRRLSCARSCGGS